MLRLFLQEEGLARLSLSLAWNRNAAGLRSPLNRNRRSESAIQGRVVSDPVIDWPSSGFGRKSQGLAPRWPGFPEELIVKVLKTVRRT